MDNDIKSGYKVKEYSQPVKRYVQMLSLRDNPELIAEYRRLHSQGTIWPEILQGIRNCGILEMEIYIKGTHLVMIVEAPIDFNWDEAMAAMGAGPRQNEWEAMMAKYQQAEAGQKSDEKWQMMERMFHIYE